jgi:hypothetical protein
MSITTGSSNHLPERALLILVELENGPHCRGGFMKLATWIVKLYREHGENVTQ